MNKDTLLMCVYTGSVDTYENWKAEESEEWGDDFQTLIDNKTLVPVLLNSKDESGYDKNYGEYRPE